MNIHTLQGFSLFSDGRKKIIFISLKKEIMRNYDYWKEQKKQNENKIILFLSGIFYRTFDLDSRVLSNQFGFKIKKTGGYEVVGFPKSALEKYLNILKEKEIGFVVFEKNEDEVFEIKKEFYSKKVLSYDKTHLIYLEEKIQEIQTEESEFQKFLGDIQNLINKYVSKI